MRVEIIRNKNNLVRFWIKCIGSILQDMSKIQRCPCLRNDRFPLSGQRFTDHKHIDDAIADIYTIYLFGLSGFTGHTSFLNELFVRFVYADNRIERVIRTLIYFQHILHLRYIFRVCLRDAPLLDLPRLDLVFFITSQTVLSVM